MDFYWIKTTGLALLDFILTQLYLIQRQVYLLDGIERYLLITLLAGGILSVIYFCYRMIQRLLNLCFYLTTGSLFGYVIWNNSEKILGYGNEMLTWLLSIYTPTQVIIVSLLMAVLFGILYSFYRLISRPDETERFLREKYGHLTDREQLIYRLVQDQMKLEKENRILREVVNRSAICEKQRADEPSKEKTKIL